MSKPTKPRKRILKKILLTLLVLLLLAGAGWYAYRSLRQEYTETYQGYTASIGSISNSLSFSGNFSLDKSETLTADSDTTVRTLYVSPGDAVKDGDKLMRMQNGQTVEAGMDGTVNTISVEAGDDVGSGDTLIQVADFTHLKVSIRVDEYDIGSVKVGDACTITATATEKQFDSQIATIDYVSASSGSVAYYTATAYVDVDEGVYPGMQATVTIPREQVENVVILKEAALSFDETNSAYVWMYNEEGQLEKVPVEVGVSNGNYVEITSGLSDGDEVYVLVQQEDTSASPLAGLFGSQQMNGPMDMGGGRDFGDMPDFGGGGGPGGGGNGGGQRGGGQ